MGRIILLSSIIGRLVWALGSFASCMHPVGLGDRPCQLLLQTDAVHSYSWCSGLEEAGQSNLFFTLTTQPPFLRNTGVSIRTGMYFMTAL